MDTLTFMIMVAYTLVPFLKVCTALDSIGQSQFLSDGMTLFSQGGAFELGFFSPSNSNERYLGIWSKKIPIQTVIWVANSVNPINDSSGILTLKSPGNLVLTQNHSIVWYTNTTSQKQAQNPVAQLLDSGNFVVGDESEANPEAHLWQSFDYPSDTTLAGMKLGRVLRTGLDWRMTSWKSPNDPSPGDFYWGLLLHNYPEFYLMKGTEKFVRIGPWNGLYFSGVPDSLSNPIYVNKYISNKDEKYYTYSLINDSVFSIMVMNQTTYMYYRYLWVEEDQAWKVYNSLPRDSCDIYGFCGAYGTCMTRESQNCRCLKGFSPRSPQAWNDSSGWSQGCVRDKPLSCDDKLNDGFVKVGGLKVPDTTHTWLDENIGLEECKTKCLNNCYCKAYANSDIRGAGSGCVTWFGDLIDITLFQDGGQDLYIRVHASELEPQNGHKKKTTTIVAATIAAICGVLLLCIYLFFKIKRNIAEKSKTEDNHQTLVDDLDLPLFDLSTITTATNDFSLENKIGQGGFGLVYKGKLVDGQQIAVKRLSRSSGQGISEFANEVKLIAKLQHRNLVKLLGCCIQGQEKLLVYEYMTNGSLDSFIFDHNRGKLIEWPRRFHIILGIARGLMYLHQDSRLRIIHRDLKTSNVLLDAMLNPKISDFGMAKAFGGDQTEGNTNRVVGTYGYMASEYIVDGLFSIKSDVFNYGILLLEVLSGSRNKSLYHANHMLNLVGYAWTLWKEGNALQLIDSNIRDSCVISEVLQCIHVGLLCVQQCPEDRPTMTSVVQMLGSEMELVEPKKPGFFLKMASTEANLRLNHREINSNNQITITSLDGR